MSINSTNPVPARLQTLRAAMQQHGIDFAWLPSSDPHLSEYLPAHWQSREYFSGFTGSMATLVVGKTQAVLFADSRYWSQAERELAGSGIELFKIKSGASAEHVGWLAAQGSGKVVAVDGAQSLYHPLMK